MSMLLEVLRWSFIAGFTAVIGLFAFVAGITIASMLFVVFSDGVLSLKEKVAERLKARKQT